MRLCLKNIGKIKTACVEINGITVIGGNNDTGKSTVGKALFAVFNSLHRSDEKIANERFDSIENLIIRFYGDVTGQIYFHLDCLDRIRDLFTHGHSQYSNSYLKNSIYEIIRQSDEEIFSKATEDDIARFLTNVDENLRINDDEIFRRVFQRRLDAEFNEQTSNQFVPDEDGEITLDIRDERITVGIKDNTVLGLNKWINLGTEAIYIDDPYVLDETRQRMFFDRRSAADHRTHLRQKLNTTAKETNIVEEIVATNKLSTIYGKLSAVCPGEIVRGKRKTTSYKVAGSDKEFRLQNLSTGLKTFVILKELLLRGLIEPNGTIILDEPEIHLHPAWQLLFAELIVLLHCEFGLHILLNTHSPYFLNAIEVYSAKYGVDDKCKYYLAGEDGDVSYIDDVTNNIERIYSKLAQPLQDLEDERYSND